MADSGDQTKPSRISSIALIAALVVIAFLLGRESNRDAPAAASLPIETTVRAPEAESPKGSPEPDARGDSPFSWEAALGDTGDARIERRRDGTVVLSNLRDGHKANPPNPSRAAEPTANTPSSIDAYFERMNAVQSGHQTTDPRSFATSLLTAAMSGSTEGFDQLVDDSERMQREIESITAPPGCEDHRQATLDALAESQAIVTELGDAMSRRDMQKIMAVAQQAKTLQAKTTELRAMEEQIRGDQ